MRDDPGTIARMRGGVFLSYRRADGDYAVLLYSWLSERFGSDSVFWDREDIDAGRDFRKVLSAELRGCRALLALVGPGWTPSPWVAKEIATAIRRRVLILPILIGGRSNLEAKDLPRSISRFAFLQTLDARDSRFRDQLMDRLAKVVARSKKGQVDTRALRVAELLRQQSDRRQEEALGLITAGDMDRAREVLEDTFDVLMALLDFRPGDAGIQVRLGFLYKDLAQAIGRRNGAAAERYIDNGLAMLSSVVKNNPDQPINLRASAWNGLGNLYLLRGDYDQAVELSSRAVKLVPTYARAWGDLFLVYDERAKQRGSATDVVHMRKALNRMKANAAGDRLLQDAFPEYDAMLAARERSVAKRSAGKKPAHGNATRSR